MNRKQAINYLASSGMTDEQIAEIVTAIERTETQELKQEFLRMASYIDSLLVCSDAQKETLMNFISRLSEYMPWYEDDDFEVEEHTPERTETHACDCGKKETHGDVIYRADALDALERIFNRCEEIEAHLPEGDPDRVGYKMYPDWLTVWKYLHQAPSAEPDWKHFKQILTNFCPNCGAKMMEVEE